MVNDAVLAQFEAQKTRGLRGFGLFDGSHLNIVRATNEKKIVKWLKRYDSNLILFHHRMPTSTINVKKAAHPFSTKEYFKDNQYILIHNGHITNSKTLKPEHEKLGIKYGSQLDDGTFNDSESLLWEFALVMEGKKEKMDCYGGIAFICVKLHKGKIDKLYFGRNSNPLNMSRDKTGIMLSSEGEGKAINPQRLYTYNYKNNRLTERFFSIKSWYNNYTPSPHTPTVYKKTNIMSDYVPRYIKNKDGAWVANPLAKQIEDFQNERKVSDYDLNGDPIYEEDYMDGSLSWNKDYHCWERKKPKNGFHFGAQNSYEDEDDELEEISRQQMIEELKNLFPDDEDDEIGKAPSVKDVQKEMMFYLLKTNGKIGEALALMEIDYQDMEEIAGKIAKDELRLLEVSMSTLETADEYIDENSISNLYKEQIRENSNR